MTQKRPHFTHPFFLGLNIHYLQQKAILYIKRHKLKMGYPEEMDVQTRLAMDELRKRFDMASLLTLDTLLTFIDGQMNILHRHIENGTKEVEEHLDKEAKKIDPNKKKNPMTFESELESVVGPFNKMHGALSEAKKELESTRRKYFP
ncbi:uncharacterized protein LOC110856922 [Folsomia candida]|nr:uncharacterized protein LOC110856922 [Folsomia candida]